MRFFCVGKSGRALLLSAVVIGAVCVSNGDNPSTLVGQWKDMNTGESVELFKDGTGAVGSAGISWKTDGKRFMLTQGGSVRICDYSLSGYELTRKFDGGEVILWVRKDMVEEYKKKILRFIYFTDSRDGQKYRAVSLGNKTWMAQNLNYRTDKSDCYGDDISNCEKYGRRYDWDIAKVACPSGWSLPSRQDWLSLESALGYLAKDSEVNDGFWFSEPPNVFTFNEKTGVLTRSRSDTGIIGEWWTADGETYGAQVYYFDEQNNMLGKEYPAVRCVKK